MYPTLNISDPWWLLATVTSPGEMLLRGLPFGSWKKIRRSSLISLATKIRLFNTTCVTVPLYGCESWVLSVNSENKINASATSCYRIMLNIKRLDCVSNAGIHEMTNTQPLINTVRQRQLCSLGHILRMPDDEPCRRYDLYLPTHGRRPGRQRTSYILYIQKLLGDIENDLHSDAIALLASDRCSWRKFVVACSAIEWWWLQRAMLVNKFLCPSIWKRFTSNVALP